MVFSNYSNTSYLPLDNDQGVTFYKNENLLFTPPPPAAAGVPATVAAGVTSPSTLVCRRNTAAAAAMLTATTGACPFGSQPLLHHGSQHRPNVCDDFQPVAHLSSNGYYGYVPASAMPKSMMSTEATSPAATATYDDGIGVLLDCHSPAVVRDSNSCSMMDCGEVENYHHLQHQQQQQQQHLRKRKENGEGEVEGNCKRRKTWLDQPPNDADFTHSPNWQQVSVQQMECHDQPMDTYSSQQFNGSPVTMNAATTAFNGFQLHHQQPQLHQTALITSPPMPAAPQPQTILQPKNRLSGASPPSPVLPPPLLQRSELADKHAHRQELEDLFISLHGSGFYLAC